LLADEGRGYDASAELAGRFLVQLAGRLGLAADGIFPAYEDWYYDLWRERRLPVNVTPEDARLADPLERERLRKVFEQGLGEIV
ncbi:transglutaminase family protein, partial [Acinetobacter baumannii]